MGSVASWSMVASPVRRLPAALGFEADPGPVGAAALVGGPEARDAGPGGGGQLLAEGRDPRSRRGRSCARVRPRPGATPCSPRPGRSPRHRPGCPIPCARSGRWSRPRASPPLPCAAPSQADFHHRRAAPPAPVWCAPPRGEELADFGADVDVVHEPRGGPRAGCGGGATITSNGFDRTADQADHHCDKRENCEASGGEPAGELPSETRRRTG